MCTRSFTLFFLFFFFFYFFNAVRLTFSPPKNARPLPPKNPEITLKTHSLSISESVNVLLSRLIRDGILIGAPKLAPPGLPNPDGDEIVDRHVDESDRDDRIREAATLPKALVTDVELNWLQVVAEGWASPLKGFMREGTLVQTLHFNSMLVDMKNFT